MSAGSRNRFAYAFDLVRADIVHDDDVATRQGRRQDLLDIGHEERSGIGLKPKPPPDRGRGGGSGSL